MLIISISLNVGLILLLIYLRHKGILHESFFRQTTAPVISGALIAFLSFSLVNATYQKNEKQRVEDVRLDAFIGIANEVSENRLNLELGIGFVPSLLYTAAWDLGKYKTPIKTVTLLDGLKILYLEIENYNWEMQFIRYKIKTDQLTEEKLSKDVKEAWSNKKKLLLAKLKEFEKLIVRESVLLGQTKKEDYIKRFGEWQSKIEISYFTK